MLFLFSIALDFESCQSVSSNQLIINGHVLQVNQWKILCQVFRCTLKLIAFYDTGHLCITDSCYMIMNQNVYRWNGGVNFVSWRTSACHSVEWTMAKSINVHSEVRAWILERVDKLTVLAAWLTGLDILCCIHFMAGYTLFTV